MLIDQETFRFENWEQLKQFRTKIVPEYFLSESIKDPNQLQSEKKEVDKLLLNAIRLCLIKEDFQKVFSYMDMFYFTNSLKLVEKMCEQLKQPELAKKVNLYLSEKENKDLYMQQQKKPTTQSTSVTQQPQSSLINDTRV